MPRHWLPHFVGYCGVSGAAGKNTASHGFPATVDDCRSQQLFNEWKLVQFMLIYAY
jgi:hypothetical protein